MSLTHDSLSDLFDDIADSIRDYNDNIEGIKADDFPKAIKNTSLQLIDNAYQPKTVGPASVISFNNGAKDIPIKTATFSIDPVQDLHGYDAPWPAGGGKNLINADGKSVSYSTTSQYVTVTASNFGDLYTALSVLPRDTTLYPKYKLTDNGSEITLANFAIYFYNGSTQIATLTYDNGGTIPSSATWDRIRIYSFQRTSTEKVMSLIRVGKSQVDVDAWTSYANICPISGWTGANIYNGYFAITNAPSDFVGTVGDTATFHVDAVTDPSHTLTYRWWYKRGSGSWARVFSGSGYETDTLTIPITSDNLNDIYVCNVRDTMLEQTIAADPVRYVATATEVNHSRPVVYDASPISVSWQTEAGTVYAGTLTDNGDGTWTLTVTHELKSMTDMVWTLTQQDHVFSSPLAGYNINSTPICSVYLSVSPSGTAASFVGKGDKIVGLRKDSNSLMVYVRDTNCDAGTDVEIVVSGQSLVYQLATPIEYTLTAETVKTLLGQNNIFADCGDINELSYYRDPLSFFPTDTIENQPVASFSDGADNIPIKSMTVNIMPVQAAGTPTPESPLPISGWTGANIYCDGKNLLNPAVTISDISCWNLAGNTEQTKSGFDYHLPDGIYTIKLNALAQNYIYGNVVNADGSFVSSFKLSTTELQPETTVTLSNSQYIKIFKSDGGTLNISSGKLQIEVGETATDYAAYNGTTYAVSWQTEAGTVYGGTLTDNGDGIWTLVNLRYMLALNGTEEFEELGTVGTDHRFRLTNSKYNPPVVQYNNTQKSSHFVWSANNGEFGTFRISATNLIIPDSAGLYTLDSFKAWLAAQYSAGTPVQIMAVLATPVEYTFTASDSEIRTLLGSNNIFADCGDIAELTYRADVGLYITKKLAEVTS